MSTLNRDSITKLKEQRDKIKATRDKLRHELAILRNSTAVVTEDHFNLWMKHVAPKFDLSVPPRDIIGHITYRSGCPVPESTPRFLHTGYLSMRQHERTLHAAGYVPRPGTVILDFGCGSARITRFLGELAPDAQVFGCDIDAAAIEWNINHLCASGQYVVSAVQPPLPQTIPMCDLILAISVFTHLPEPMQNLWLAELRSRLKPGGYLLATFHGEAFVRFIPAAQRADFEAKGYAYANLGLTEGLPGYYQSAFHSADYVRKHWGSGFAALHHAPAANGAQDVAVLVNE
ncbi:MAG: class I SAM-dependent methyltransferase [Verrucomicrobiales bacterium]